MGLQEEGACDDRCVLFANYENSTMDNVRSYRWAVSTASPTNACLLWGTLHSPFTFRLPSAKTKL
jgi:hypothetical protein